MDDLISEMSFALPFYVKGNKLYLKCVVNKATKANEWMFLKPDQSWSNEFPDCNYLCQKDPFDDPKLYNRDTYFYKHT